MAVRTAFAAPEDAEEIANVRSAASAALTDEFGEGHWSGPATPRGVLSGIETSRVLVARERGRIVGTLRLATRKPWAIDASYFAPVKRPLYLVDMAVAPHRQRSGIGRTLLGHADIIARNWPAEAIRLDAYDAPAGAGGFYARCGFREVGRVVYRSVPLIYFERVL
jgi:GNAT superfamily N-acetyltransferase